MGKPISQLESWWRYATHRPKRNPITKMLSHPANEDDWCMCKTFASLNPLCCYKDGIYIDVSGKEYEPFCGGVVEIQDGVIGYCQRVQLKSTDSFSAEFRLALTVLQAFPHEVIYCDMKEVVKRIQKSRLRYVPRSSNLLAHQIARSKNDEPVPVSEMLIRPVLAWKLPS